MPKPQSGHLAPNHPVDAANWTRIEELFHEALEQPIREQSEFVTRRANNDPIVLAEVISLLRSHHSGNSQFLVPQNSSELSDAIDGKVVEVLSRSSAAEASSDTKKRTSSTESIRTGEQHSESVDSEDNRDAWRDLVVKQMSSEFEIDDVLSVGGMGTVFRGRDRKLDRPVAIKVISGTHHNETAIRRFIRESKLAAQVTSENVVTIYSVDDDPQLPKIVMELVEGPTLRDLIKRNGGLPFDKAAEYAQQTAVGLADAHEQNLIHRDIKPGNLMLQAGGATHDSESEQVLTGRIKIIDFGIARDLNSNEETRLNALAGTPSFMSPEQLFAPETIDHRCDIYAVGASLYQMLTGEAPYKGAPHMIVRQMEKGAVTPPRRLDDRIPVALESICLKAMAHDRKHRYQTANALARDLQRFLDRKPTMAKPVSSFTRLRLWQRRNQSLALALSLLIISLLAGTILSSIMWNRSSRNANRATENASLAKENAELANRRAERLSLTKEKLASSNSQMREAIDSFFMNLLDNESERSNLSTEFHYKLLQQMTEYYDSVVEHSDNDPQLITEVSEMMVTFNESMLENGARHPGQMRFVVKWVDKQLGKIENESKGDSLQRIRELNAHNEMIGIEAKALNEPHEVKVADFEHVAQLAKDVYAANQSKRAERISLLTQGMLIIQRFKEEILSPEKAHEELSKISKDMDWLAERSANEPRFSMDQARVRRWLAKVSAPAQAIGYREQASEVLQQALATTSDSNFEELLRRKLSVNQVWLGYAHAQNQNFDRAFELYDESIETMNFLSERNPSNNQFRMDLAETEYMVADLRWYRNDRQASLAAYDRALRAFQATFDSDPSQLNAKKRIAQVNHVLAMRKQEFSQTETLGKEIDEHFQLAIESTRARIAMGVVYISGKDLSYFAQLLEDAIRYYSDRGQSETAKKLQAELEAHREAWKIDDNEE